MKNTILLAEAASAEALHEPWPKFAPGGDKKNGHWIALAVYTDGPKGPTTSELLDALTKKLSGKTAEAKRGRTTFNSPLLPKLRGVDVRGAEIPGVSPNSMSENSDLLVYVVEFDTYMPKLFEIAETVLEDLVLSKKDEYDRANGPVEGGYSALYSAAKAMRLDMDSVYSATDARQRRYMGEAVDPKLFGELRSLLASPLEADKVNTGYGDTFLRLVWRAIVEIEKQGAQADEIEAEVMPYVDGVLGRLDDRFLSLSANVVDKIISGKMRDITSSKLSQNEQDFYIKYQRAIEDSQGGQSIQDTKTLNALTDLNIGSMPHHKQNYGFLIEVSKPILTSQASLSKLLKWVRSGRSDLHLTTTYSFNESRPPLMARIFNNLLQANPKGLKTTFRPSFREAPSEADLIDFLTNLGADGGGAGDVTLIWSGAAPLDEGSELVNLLERHVRFGVVTRYESMSGGRSIKIIF